MNVCQKYFDDKNIIGYGYVVMIRDKYGEICEEATVAYFKEPFLYLTGRTDKNNESE
jgi:hypothetical protein